MVRAYRRVHIKMGEKGTPLEDVTIVHEEVPDVGGVKLSEAQLEEIRDILKNTSLSGPEGFCPECGEPMYEGKVGSCYTCADVYTAPDEEED